MMSRCVGSSSTSRMRQASCDVALGEGAGSLMCPGSYPQAPRLANSSTARGGWPRSAVADLDRAVQGFDPDTGVAVAFLEAQLVAGPVFARAARLRPEAMLDVAVEGLDVE